MKLSFIPPSPYLESSYIKSTLKYLDEFYQVINNPKLAERELISCLADGTGDVVIKGLNSNRVYLLASSGKDWYFNGEITII